MTLIIFKAIKKKFVSLNRIMGGKNKIVGKKPDQKISLSLPLKVFVEDIDQVK